MSLRSRIPGVATATVIDRDNSGQVKLNYAWLDASMASDWVPVAAPMAGGRRGLYMMPEIGMRWWSVSCKAISTTRSCSVSCGTAWTCRLRMTRASG